MPEDKQSTQHSHWDRRATDARRGACKDGGRSGLIARPRLGRRRRPGASEVGARCDATHCGRRMRKATRRHLALRLKLSNDAGEGIRSKDRDGRHKQRSHGGRETRMEKHKSGFTNRLILERSDQAHPFPTLCLFRTSQLRVTLIRHKARRLGRLGTLKDKPYGLTLDSQLRGIKVMGFPA